MLSSVTENSALYYIGATAILFIVCSVSLVRLKHIGVLSLQGRNTKPLPQIENVLHSIGKLLLTVFLSVLCARAIVSPNYPNGLGHIDLRMLYYGGITLLSSLPQIGMIAILSPTIGGKELNKSLLFPALVLSVLATGFGQLLAVSFAAQLSMSSVFSNSIVLFPAIIACGGILTIGVYMHFVVMKKLTQEAPSGLKLPMIDAAIASVPTMLAVLIASMAILLRVAPTG